MSNLFTGNRFIVEKFMPMVGFSYNRAGIDRALFLKNQKGAQMGAVLANMFGVGITYFIFLAVGHPMNPAIPAAILIVSIIKEVKMAKKVRDLNKQ